MTCKREKERHLRPACPREIYTCKANADNRSSTLPILQQTPPLSMSTLEKDLAKVSARVCKHMNVDHGSSLRAWAVYYLHVVVMHSTVLEMTKCDTHGFWLSIDGTEPARVPYNTDLKSVSQIRKVAVDMHHAAFKGLGFSYRVQNGYYDLGKKLHSKVIIGVVAAVSVVVVGVVVMRIVT